MIRNERQAKLYNFDDGKGFEPDFILLLQNDNMHYQLFIEPKGNHLLDKDKWKQDFLKKITEHAKLEDVKVFYADNEYKIIGLPFYNYASEKYFEKEFAEELELEV